MPINRRKTEITVSTTTPDLVVGNNTATTTTTVGAPVGDIPALSPLLLAMLAAMLGGLALLKLKS